MSQQRTYSFSKENESVLLRFEKFVSVSDRSGIIGSLMKDYLDRHAPDTRALKAQRAREMKEAQERLEKLMSIDKLEADKALAEQESSRLKLVESERRSNHKHFFDDCRKRAKVLTNLEFGLDGLSEILPSVWTVDMREKYKVRWKAMTEELISRGNNNEVV